ncbi:MAG: 2OG-Fe(II) oxygenase [Sciscionella sp.]
MAASPLTVVVEPFRHVTIDGWLDAELLRDVLGEFPDPRAAGWRRYSNGNERKLEGPPVLWGPCTRELFTELAARAPMLEEAFGIEGLTMETIGGGYHAIEPGGYLAVHADFNRSPATGRHRRLNCLTYLNDDWTDPGGHLELWNGGGCVVDVVPSFGRTVIFETSGHSWHGHPRPASRWRYSVATYFFSQQPPSGVPRADQSTVWHADAR